PIGAGVVHASRCLHTSSQSLAPVPPLPEKGGKVRHGIIPEELFQLLYPKTGVTGVVFGQSAFCDFLIWIVEHASRHLDSLWLGLPKNWYASMSKQHFAPTENNNVAMLLETNYRERLHMVTNEVKRRLDYQIALQDLHRRMEQEHMINWVEKSVVSSITPQQEKESIAKCITDLKALAKTTQAKATA
uniref:ATP synthase subunit b n=1 Tax=Amphilophus citrinellus TaxID=61819 RepID=A0A3Q0R9C9_AMPCI